MVLETDLGKLHSDLRVGANLAIALSLESNAGVCTRGVQLMGSGFLVTPEDAVQLGLGSLPGLERHVRAYRNGRDLTQTPRGILVIDLFGLLMKEVRDRFPDVYQWVLQRVKPERDHNNRASYRENWWIFGEPNPGLRRQIEGLGRYIATVRTAKHRIFQFLSSEVVAESKVVVVASEDAFQLGTLSSRLHAAWALVAGGWETATHRFDINVSPNGDVAWTAAEVVISQGGSSNTSWQLAVWEKLEDRWKISAALASNLPSDGSP